MNKITLANLQFNRQELIDYAVAVIILSLLVPCGIELLTDDLLMLSPINGND